MKPITVKGVCMIATHKKKQWVDTAIAWGDGANYRLKKWATNSAKRIGETRGEYRLVDCTITTTPKKGKRT